MKIRVRIPLAKIAQWPAKKAEIEAWAAKNGVQLCSLEPIVEAAEAEEGAALADAGGEAPDEVLEAFAGQEGITGRTLKMGRRLLAAAMAKGK